MANIIIAGVKIPFVSGGQEALVRSLARELRVFGDLPKKVVLHK